MPWSSKRRIVVSKIEAMSLLYRIEVTPYSRPIRMPIWIRCILPYSSMTKPSRMPSVVPRFSGCQNLAKDSEIDAVQKTMFEFGDTLIVEVVA